MKILGGIPALLLAIVALAQCIQHVSAQTICRAQINNGEGLLLRKGGSELCKNKKNVRDVDLYTWPGTYVQF